jgi:Bacterial Ig-like domain (group 3)
MKSQRDVHERELVCLLLLVGIILSAAQSGLAQNGLQNPLNFGNNFLVTGDYIVAGANGMNTNWTTINGTSYTVGTITVPDGNPGIQAGVQLEKQVPTGAQVVSALLYWQTVEMVGAKAGGPGSGQNGFFRPLLYKNSGGPASPGYAISGTNVGSTNAVTWSFGTCSGTSSNKVTRTYRADVTGGLPVDANGNSLANGSFEVRLPSVGTPATPLTFGATLVIIYRIPTGAGGPSIPLNAIVIYDGGADPGAAQLSMTQQLWGLQDADRNAISRLTLIVAGGSSGRFQTVFLSSGANALVALPSLYSKGLPTFPGYYGNYGWDSPTWTFTSASTNPSNPVMEDAAYATTQVVSSTGCVSWAAAVVSTTVKNSDQDGILDIWKYNPHGPYPGYCDVALNPSCSGPGDPAWVPLPGATPGQHDVFLQYDYMCSNVTGPNSCDISTQRDSLSAASAASGGTTTYTGTFSPTIPANTLVGITGFTKPANNGQFTVVSCTSTSLVVNNPSGVAEMNPGLATYAKPGDLNYSFDPRMALDTEDGKVVHDSAVDKVVEAYAKHGITLHAIPGNAILEGGPNNPVSCADTDPTCTFPNEPGTIGFREGLAYIKNTNILTSTGVIGGCTVGTDAGCAPVFQHGKKDSYHYALFSHGVGLPSWFLSDGSLASVKQSGNTVTFTTQSPHGISRILAQPGTGATANDNSCLLGRVTVVFAITNSNLEGTFCVLSNPAPTANTFSITVGGNPTNFTYTSKTDPNLSVANGQVPSMSGYSDVGGQNSVISLGYGGWGPPNNPFSEGNKWQIRAGTFMHELGHTMALTHGGTFYNNLQHNPVDYTPNFEVNCKPNVQTSMSYLFQFDLLQTGQFYANNQPIKVVDYSGDPPPLSPQLVPPLTESSPTGPNILNNLTYPYTSWFQLTSYNGASAATSHCDGSPAPAVPSYSYTTDAASNFFWSNTNPPGITGNDINFSGSTTDVMDPHNEWGGTPPQNGAGSSPGIDLLQVSAVGTVSTTGVGGEAGGLKPQGGGGGLKPQGGGGGLKPQGGGGGLKPAGGGGGLKPQGGGGLKAEITHGQANSYAHPPQGLFIVQEEASPRLIDLTWFSPTIGAVVQYNISRSVAGGAFAPLTSVPGSQTTYTDTVTCDPGGYSYRIAAVTLNDQGQQQVSSPSNTVPASGQEPVTGCYASPVTVTVQASAVQGTIVPITWTLTDDFYITPGTGWQNAAAGNPVTNLAANTLVANGPIPGKCGTSGPTTILLKGTVQKTYQNDTSSFSVTNAQTGQFTFNSDTDGLCAGTYTFTLTSDSGQQFTSSALQLAIDINDQDNPNITTLTLPPSTVGLAYNDTLTEDGGTAPFTWTVSGLPAGISQQAPGSPTLSGMTCVAAGSYNVGATVSDAKSNSGTQAFTLQVNKANTTTTVASSADPSVFQQLVTFKVTVSPQYGCTPTGTVTLSVDGSQVGSNTLTNGMATFSLSNLSVSLGGHSITASYGGDSSFNSSSSGVLLQIVNPAPTQIVVNSVSPSTIFVGQPITISYTFSVPAPGAGSPIVPSGNIAVSASDGSSCMAAAVLGPGMCQLSPSPTAAGNVTFTVAYAGDTNFVASGANGNYTVYQLVFTKQPSNTGVGLTITPEVAVTVEDSNSNTLTSFTGAITLAIGSGPGTLSGTTPQNAVAGVATFGDLSIDKIANGYMLTASPSGGVPDATSNAFNIDTFYVDGQGNFGTLDLPTGTVTQIGVAGTVSGSNGIDLTPGLNVYAYNTLNQLMQITPSTGAASQIGSGTIPDQATAGALTDGSYFGIDAVTGILYSINLATGATTQVGAGATSAAVLPPGCNLDSSLTGSASVLYYTIGYSGTGCTAFPDTLYQIDPTSGATTVGVQVTVNGSNVNEFVGSAFVGGTLYGFTSGGQEYTIDPATGVATSLANTTPTTAIFGAGSSQ